MDPLTRREFIAGGALALGVPNMELMPVPQSRAAQNLLATAYPIEKVRAILLPRGKWHPFATAAERVPWEGLPSEDRKAGIDAGERALEGGWPELPATLFLGYARDGNRSKYEAVRDRRRDRLCDLALAECIEGKGRFTDGIVNGVWTACEESYWGVPAHLGMQKAGPGLPDINEPTVDLFAAETSSELAWILYLIGPQLDKVSTLVRERIHSEVDRRVLTPNLTRNFGWMGFPERPDQPVRPPNNWNPWINSNWLASTLLLEKDEKRRCASVHRILQSLDMFLSGYHGDGGCDEGPGYWFRAGGSLFDCLELLLSATDGALNVFDQPLVREIGRYIYRVHIHNRYFINFADASSVVNPDGDLLFRYGSRIGDEKLAALGAFAAQSTKVGNGSDSIGRQLPALFDLGRLRAAPAYQPLVRDAWFPGIQVMSARRKEKSPEGLYLAAQGGNNAESHNHNDVGNFIVFADGLPAIIDVGVETYSAMTFSARRYEIWTMQSAYHNLPTIGGVMQKDGLEFAASEVQYHADDHAAEFSLNISGAYPAEAGLESWRRSLRLDRDRNALELTDAPRFKKRVPRISWTFMTPCAPEPAGPGKIAFSGTSFPSGKVTLAYDAAALKPAIEEIPLKDSRLRGAWGERVFRILLHEEDPPRESIRVFRIAQ